MNPISLDRAISALENSISHLDASSASLDIWLKFFTALVAVGVAFEIVVIFVEYLEAHRAWRRSSIRTPEKPSVRFLVFNLLGILLVTGGVAGELWVSVRSGNVNTSLRIDNGKLVSLVNQKAGYANESARDAEAQASAAEGAAGRAKYSADQARNEAIKAKSELVKLRADAQNLAAEANKTEDDLKNISVCNAPRVIVRWFMGGSKGSSSKSYVDPLTPMAGQVVFIEFSPDAEAQRAAQNIARTLMDAKWDVQLPLREVVGLQDGVSVQPSNPPFHLAKGKIPNLSLYWHADDVADKLVDFLHSYDWEARRGWWVNTRGALMEDPTIAPPGSIRIQVGLYPPEVYASPPGTKELATALQHVKQETDKKLTEIERKREARLNKMPPNIKKEIEEEDRKFDAQIKSETSSGPCQTVLPLY